MMQCLFYKYYLLKSRIYNENNEGLYGLYGLYPTASFLNSSNEMYHSVFFFLTSLILFQSKEAERMQQR